MLGVASCAQLPTASPIVDGATHRVSQSDIRVAINIFEQFYIGEGKSVPRINKVHISDQNNIQIHYHPPPDSTDEWRSVVRVKGKWQLDNVIISLPKNQIYKPLRQTDLD